MPSVPHSDTNNIFSRPDVKIVHRHLYLWIISAQRIQLFMFSIIVGSVAPLAAKFYTSPSMIATAATVVVYILRRSCATVAAMLTLMLLLKEMALFINHCE